MVATVHVLKGDAGLWKMCICGTAVLQIARLLLKIRRLLKKK